MSRQSHSQKDLNLFKDYFEKQLLATNSQDDFLAAISTSIQTSTTKPDERMQPRQAQFTQNKLPLNPRELLTNLDHPNAPKFANYDTAIIIANILGLVLTEVSEADNDLTLSSTVESLLNHRNFISILTVHIEHPEEAVALPALRLLALLLRLPIPPMATRHRREALVRFHELVMEVDGQPSALLDLLFTLLRFGAGGNRPSPSYSAVVDCWRSLYKGPLGHTLLPEVIGGVCQDPSAYRLWQERTGLAPAKWFSAIVLGDK